MAINTIITSIKKRSNFFMRFDPVSVQDENQLFFGILSFLSLNMVKAFTLC